MAEERTKTSMSLNKKIYHEAQHYAIDADLDVNRLFELAVSEYIKNHPIKAK